MPNNNVTHLFTTVERARQDNKVLINGGGITRNRDFWSGKAIQVIPDGIRTNFYDINPLVLYMHNAYIPLGQSDVYKEGGKIWAHNLKFHRRTVPIPPGWSEGLSEFNTGVIADLWEDKMIMGASVRIDFTDEDLSNIDESGDVIVLATSELVEWSVCTLMAERESVQQKLMSLGVSPKFADFIPVIPDEPNGVVVVRPPELLVPKEYEMGNMEGQTPETEATPLKLTDADVAAFSSIVLGHVMGDAELMKKFAAAIQPHLEMPARTDEKPRAFTFDFSALSVPEPTKELPAPAQSENKQAKPMTAAELRRVAQATMGGKAFA